MSTLHERISNLSPEKRTLLAKQLLKKNEASASRPAIPRRPAGDSAPLSFAQQRLWFLAQLEPESPFYNVPTVLRFRGRLDLPALEESLAQLIQRHEVLRTTFTIVDGQPVQVIAPAAPVSLPVDDLRHLPPDEREVTARNLALAETQQPFDLSRGPLLRVRLLHLAPDDYLVLFTLHHIITDGWSIDILLREVVMFYTAAHAGETAALPDLPIQYADFAVWQRGWLQGAVLEEHLAYWQQQLQGAPPLLELPTDHPRPAVQTWHGATHPLTLPESLAQALRRLSQQNGCTLFMTLLAAFQLLLARYSGQTDICVGTPIANRTRAELEPLIGFFVNTLVLRSDLSDNPTFRALLQQVREVTLGAYAHQDVPFELLVDTLKPTRSLSHNPLFQVMFVLQNMPFSAQSLPDLTLEPVPLESGTTNFDLTLSLEDGPAELTGQIEYNTDLFDAATIARMAGHFAILLEGIIANPDQPIAGLPLLSEVEHQQLLIAWNATAAPYPHDRRIHDLFETTVERVPNAVAVTFEDERLTYRELNHRANQLAHYLQQHGIGAETLVGICLERSLDMLVALLGVWKAGGAYIPLDPNYPAERLAFMLADSHAPILLTQSTISSSSWTAARSSGTDSHQPLNIIVLDRDWEDIARYPLTNPTSDATPESLAYVIYTSGSTGQPKGVLLEHGGLCNLVQEHIQAFGITSESQVLQFASFSFDASVSEIGTTLVAGGTLHLAPRRTLHDLSELLHVMREREITMVTLPPSLLAVLPDEGLPALHTVVSAGERCSWDVALRWGNGRRFLNAYGPTETTVGPSYYAVSDPVPATASVPIGRPIANMQIYLLDTYRQPVPVGVPGEVYVGGVGLARGYLNRPALTAEKFIPSPFAETIGSRLYKTGDIARYVPDGNLEFLGRRDDQVKLRSFRVELAEIEAVLNTHPAIQAAVVVVREDTPGDQRLVTYIVPAESITLTLDEIQHQLRQQLPEYMVPGAVVLLDALPLTPNGKVDRRALPAPDRVSLATQHSIEPPRDALERELVHIWEETLNVGSIGIRDNFFELGGHSLLAVQLLSLIEQRLGKQLSMVTFFQNATIEHLAREMRRQDNTALTSSLVELQPGSDDRLPIFFVHPSGGSVHWYTDLARYLGPDQPFYGLQAKGLNGDEELHTRIEAMAAHYIAAIQTVQPTGPYLIGSWSLGVIIAFEMAQQLDAQNHEVALLALLDQGPTMSFETLEDDAAFMLDVFDWELPLSLDDLRQLETDQQYQRVLEEAKKQDVVPPDITFSQFRHFIAMLKVQVQAWRDYTPGPYPGKITLFRTAEQLTRDRQAARTNHSAPSQRGLRAKGGALMRMLTGFRSRSKTVPAAAIEEPLERDMGWGPLAAGGMDVYEVPGNHRSMVFNPYVKVLARHMRECIDAVQIEQ